MISQLSMCNVASFKDTPAVLTTDKRVNLIYGLNGTGKSTISNYLFDREHPNHTRCSIKCDGDEELLVYNQKFIEDTFFEAESLKGIFTLSKENKDAQTAINNAANEIVRLGRDKQTKEDEIASISSDLAHKTEVAKSKCWEIKTNYAGPDRVLDFCLRDLKGSKHVLFEHINSVSKPLLKPNKTIEDLEEEVRKVSGGNAVSLTELEPLSFPGKAIETQPIFAKVIVGSKTSTVADLIETLQNSDWVKTGLKFLPEKLADKNEKCPFCQEETIKDDFLANIKNYFDQSYENDRNSIASFLKTYLSHRDGLPRLSNLTSHQLLAERKTLFDAKFNELTSVINQNVQSMKTKLTNPSKAISLANTQSIVDDLNSLISDANAAVVAHNAKISNLGATKAAIKTLFWRIMRWEYDQTLENIGSDKELSEARTSALKKEISGLEEKIKFQTSVISTKQKETVNVDDAVVQINNGLLELGIDDFSIKNANRPKEEGDFYKLVRGDHDEDVFMTLSEGEKMIISFLYFLEKCRGKNSPTSTPSKKIVLIDDPISSLSHIYVFNVGRMIHNEFLRGDKYEQIFVLTHSLYFFYELTDIDKTRRDENQNLFRLRKNAAGSEILTMKYEEIQNDYHAFWSIVKDEDQHPALIANCMRNIIEYFFGFVEKISYNNVFQKKELEEIRFQAFCRYMHRHSHSLGQNVFDHGEFVYEDFKEALRLVFKLTDYEDHYKRMMRR